MAVACGLLAGVEVVAAGVGVVAGVGVAGSLPEAGALPAPPVPTSQAGLPQETFCQWSFERGGKVVVFGDGIEAFRVRYRDELYPKSVSRSVTVDVPNRPGRQWVGIRLNRTQEDDVRVVSCKVGGAWRLAEPA